MEVYTLADAERIIAANLHRLRGFDTVVGIPRSGSIFAAHIATQLGISLADVATAGRSIRVQKHGHISQENLGRVLLVEDVVNRGVSLSQAFEVLTQTTQCKDFVTCALWTNPRTASDAVDINLGGTHAARYAFTWQMWHSNLWPIWATDFDGVLCMDPPAHESHNAYRAWIESAPAKWLPKPRSPHPIGAIVTTRPEGVRSETQSWLDRHGIAYSRLIMAPGSTEAEVIANLKAQHFTRGEWKAYQMRKLCLDFFVESCPKQSIDISAGCDALVWCTGTQQRFRQGQVVDR